MKKAIQILEKEPRRRMNGTGYPIWYHHHGDKMRQVCLDHQQLVIEGSAARVIITKASTIYPRAKGWFVDYEVVQYQPYDEMVRGRRRFDDEDLAAAFALTDSLGERDYGEWIVERFGGSSANQGKYLRYRCCLNIPGPGIGCDGDANVSIDIKEDMQKAVAQLLGRDPTSLKPLQHGDTVSCPL